jgi:hypothetical protein
MGKGQREKESLEQLAWRKNIPRENLYLNQLQGNLLLNAKQYNLVVVM